MNELELVLAENLHSAPSWWQLGVLVNDGSGSMTLPYAAPDESLPHLPASTTKGAAVDAAIRDLLAEMKQSRVATNFLFSFVSFNDRVTEERPPERLLDIDLARGFDPTAAGIGGTAIHSGLDAAVPIVEGFMRRAAQHEMPASAVVVVMSDGEERDDPAKTAASAARVRELPNTLLAGCLFATAGQPAHGEQLLQSIVSEPRLYERVYDARQLRAFFQASVTATGVALTVRGR